jgi:hypothetical protein
MPFVWTGVSPLKSKEWPMVMLDFLEVSKDIFFEPGSVAIVF